MSPIDLAVVDTDGAVREAEEAVAGDTRAAFFRKAAIGGGAALTAGSILGMLPEVAGARPTRRRDIRILNYALTLEYLEAAFYKQAVTSGGLSGQTLELAKLISDHEATHVTALRQTIKSLKGKAVSSPKFDFKGTNTGDQFLPTAFVLENVGVRAYLGQAARLKSNALLNAAASIVTVEARHAAGVAALLNQSPYNTGAKSITPSGAFDRRSSMKTILGEVADTGFIKS